MRYVIIRVNAQVHEKIKQKGSGCNPVYIIVSENQYFFMALESHNDTGNGSIHIFH